MEIERRFLPTDNSELRSSGRHISGLAVVWNSRSQNLGGFYEVILPEAIDGVVERSDVLATIDHDRSRVLGRCVNGKGSLQLTREPKGLRYELDAPRTSTGDELLEMLKRGDITGSSFAFTLQPGGDRWDKLPDGSNLRTITKIDKLWDVAAVFSPAYVDTSVALRGLEQFTGVKPTSSISEAELERQYNELKRKQQKQPTTTIAQDIAATEVMLAKEEAYARSLEKPQGLVFINPPIKPIERKATPKKKKGGRKGLFGI